MCVAECIEVAHAAMQPPTCLFNTILARPGNLGFPASPPIERNTKIWRCTCHNYHDCHRKRSPTSVYVSLNMGA